MTKVTEFERKRNAAALVLDFMGRLAYRLTFQQWHYLNTAMEAMQNRYGIIFVADTIRKDPNGAEWALWKYGAERKKA